MDRFIHRIFAIQQTGLTDRIDDAIIALYGFFGLGVLWLFRRELMHFRPILKPLGFGFVLLAGSVLFDTLGARSDVIFSFARNVRLTKVMKAGSRSVMEFANSSRRDCLSSHFTLPLRAHFSTTPAFSSSNPRRLKSDRRAASGAGAFA